MERLTDNTNYCSSWSDCEIPECKCKFFENCYDRKIYDKLREYEDAEEQGMLVRLPEGCEDAELEVLISTYEVYLDAQFEEAGFALYYPRTKKFHSVYGDRLDITEIVKAWRHLPEPYKEK